MNMIIDVFICSLFKKHKMNSNHPSTPGLLYPILQIDFCSCDISSLKILIIITRSLYIFTCCKSIIQFKKNSMKTTFVYVKIERRDSKKQREELVVLFQHYHHYHHHFSTCSLSQLSYQQNYLSNLFENWDFPKRMKLGRRLHVSTKRDSY